MSDREAPRERPVSTRSKRRWRRNLFYAGALLSAFVAGWGSADKIFGAAHVVARAITDGWFAMRETVPGQPRCSIQLPRVIRPLSTQSADTRH